ncbi:PhnD/SsuA/transferrin family substrate-binding protein [Alkalilimnicola ehrlichii MLHE-1]|uniref:PhnD/SsuA/transferrin family substrate-binding protein n=1 Tax=Alkalilimnicola ehrlichii TaxID=351052 RepID=UPI0038CC06BC
MVGLAWLILAGPAQAQMQVLRFAPLPMQDAEAVVREFRPLLAFLEARLGVRFEIDYSTDYGEILEKFRSGEVDLAYLGPLPYVELRDRDDAVEPLVVFREPDGQAHYTCSVVMFADDRQPLGALAGQSVALTQPLSTCGYLAVKALLRPAGVRLEHTRYDYLGRHDEVALAVVRGDYQAGGMKTHIARRYEHLGLVRVAETGPLPGFALVANARTVTPELQAGLRGALMSVHPGERPEDAELVTEWGEPLRHGVETVSDEDYEPVRRLRDEVPIPGQGREDWGLGGVGGNRSQHED